MRTAPGLACVLAVLLPTVVARADAPGSAPAGPSSATASQEGDERFRQGLELARHGRAEEARLAFLEAYSVDPKLDVLWNLAIVEVVTHHDVEALQHLRTVLAAPNVDAETRSAAQRLIDEEHAKTGHVRVIGAPGAALSVDGAQVVASAGASEIVDVTPGEHRVGAIGEAGTASTRVTVGAGDTVDASLGFPAGAEPPVSASAGSSTTRIVVASTFGILAVTGAITGGLLEANATREHNEGVGAIAGVPAGGCANTTSGPCATANSDLHEEVTTRNTATGLFIAAGVLAAGAAASWFLLAPRSSLHPSAYVLPELSPKGAALTLRGDF